MKLVTMTRDMRPFQAGHDAFLPDDVAARLVEAGAAENLRDLPDYRVAPMGDVPPPAKSYRTKAGK